MNKIKTMTKSYHQTHLENNIDILPEGDKERKYKC